MMIRHGRQVPTESPLVVRVDEAARLLQCSRSQIYNLVGQGLIPHVRVGSRGVRIPRAALDRWLTAHTAGGGVEVMP